LADERDRRSTADHRDGGKLGGRNPVVLQHISECVEKSRQSRRDDGLQFGPRQPDLGACPGQIDRHHRGGLRGEPFLGQAALLAQPGQRPDGSGPGGVLGSGRPDSGQHLIEQGLVDLVTGELDESQRLADRGEVGRGVGQRDGAAAATEIAQRDHPAGR
jgi:hypothetical protein